MSGVPESAAGISESCVEDAALDRLAGLGWTVARGPDVAPNTPDAERGDYGNAPGWCPYDPGVAPKRPVQRRKLLSSTCVATPPTCKRRIESPSTEASEKIALGRPISWPCSARTSTRPSPSGRTRA